MKALAKLSGDLMCAALLLFGCGRANGAANGPGEAAEQFIAAMSEKDYQRAAELMHPDALQEYRDGSLAILENMGGGQAADTEEIYGLSGIATLGDLKALSPSEFFVLRYSNFDSLTSQMGGMVPMGIYPPGTDIQVLGFVNEGETDAHVVVRNEQVVFRAETYSAVRLLSVRRDDGGWKVLLPEELARSLALMKAATKMR